jgi:hypothetical protein
LLLELKQRFGFSLEQLARRFGRVHAGALAQILARNAAAIIDPDGQDSEHGRTGAKERLTATLYCERMC